MKTLSFESLRLALSPHQLGRRIRRDDAHRSRPIVERTYRVAPGRENRAMAGLSIGSAAHFPMARIAP